MLALGRGSAILLGSIAVAIPLLACGGKSAQRVEGAAAAGGDTTNGGSGGTSSTGGSTSSTGGSTSSAGGAAASAGAGGIGGTGGTGGCSATEPFPDLLYAGVWLCGWSGGLIHDSWIRFTPGNEPGTQGSWTSLADDCGACTGYFPCEGTGTFVIPQSMHVTLTAPPTCSASWTSESWTVSAICPDGSSAPSGSNSVLRVATTGLSSIECYRFPFERCDASLTSCESPWP